MNTIHEMMQSPIQMVKILLIRNVAWLSQFVKSIAYHGVLHHDKSFRFSLF